MELTYEYFHARIGRQFVARADDGTATSSLVLHDIERQKTRETNRAIRKDPFSLTFHGPAQTDVGRRLLHLSCEGEEGSILFNLEPISMNGTLLEYEGFVG